MFSIVIDNDSLNLYMKKINGFASLSFEDEQAYANDWINTKNPKAAEALINSHLKLVVKVANSFRGYGLPLTEMIQEGNIGLIQSINKFDPDKGFRFSTYAMWWIKSLIQEYVLNQWSLVRVGTTAGQKKLFFNLRRLKEKLQENYESSLTDSKITQIANELNVREEEVRSMEQRMGASDKSLNTLMSADSDDEMIDWLTQDNVLSQEAQFSKEEENKIRSSALVKALETLNEREKQIFIARNIYDVEKVPTLDDLSQVFKISKERVRQIEAKAFEKVTKAVKLQITKADIA